MNKNETTELTVVQRAAIALGTSEREAQLVALVNESASIVEIKNKAGRDQCHSAAMKLRTTRGDIEKAGKAAREDATAFSKAVIAEEKRLVAITGPEEERLLGLRDVWDEAREAERRAKVEAEARRIAGIRAKIDGIRAYVPTMAGQSSSVIEETIKTMVALPIDVDHFAELTGDAEMARGETLDKLRGMHSAALAQEAEARRVAEETARLARERAEFEEQQRRAAVERAEQERRDAAARAEQERKDAEARAAREAEERAQRDREEAARREQQAREDAERRAAIEAEEKLLAAERAEVARRQAELDRADQEQREREEAAARETAEAAARAEQELRKRQSSENLAARNAPEMTGGLWFARGTEILTTVKLAGAQGTGHNSAEYYGDGALIAESVWRPADAQLMAASRELLEALQAMVHKATKQNWNDSYPEQLAQAFAAIEKATYVPEVQPEAQAA